MSDFNQSALSGIEHELKLNYIRRYESRMTQIGQICIILSNNI